MRVSIVSKTWVSNYEEARSAADLLKEAFGCVFITVYHILDHMNKYLGLELDGSMSTTQMVDSILRKERDKIVPKKVREKLAKHLECVCAEPCSVRVKDIYNGLSLSKGFLEKYTFELIKKAYECDTSKILLCDQMLSEDELKKHAWDITPSPIKTLIGVKDDHMKGVTVCVSKLILF